jgi:hypothetical protein
MADEVAQPAEGMAEPERKPAGVEARLPYLHPRIHIFFASPNPARPLSNS